MPKETEMTLVFKRTFNGDLIHGDPAMIALIDSLKKYGIELAGNNYPLASVQFSFIEQPEKE